ncbi:MAG: hypothetical protein ACYDDF_02895 [Thermoplasmatota archaeon]
MAPPRSKVAEPAQPRIWVDASTLIALAKIGHLDVLRLVGGEVWTTTQVLAEVDFPDRPEVEQIQNAVKHGWIRKHESRDLRATSRFGLGRGEASLFEAAAAHDLLVLDDLAARRVSEVQGRPRTGLLGLLVAGASEGKLPKGRALAVLDALANSTFRMNVDLYRSIRNQLETGDEASPRL